MKLRFRMNGRKKATTVPRRMIFFVVLFVAANVVAAVPRQIGEVVSAMCTPTNGSASFCVAGFVAANHTATNVTVAGVRVVGDWKLNMYTLPVLVDDRSPDALFFPLFCTADGRGCQRDGKFAEFGNYSFAIDFRMRSNATSEKVLMSGPAWSMSVAAAGTLQFKFQVRASGQRQQVGRDFRVESRTVINDGQLHNVRFSRSGSLDFAFAFDEMPETNVTFDIPDKFADIRSAVGEPVTNFVRQPFVVWLGDGVSFETVSVSIGDLLTTQLFSFDSTTDGSVVLGDELVGTFGCTRNSMLCQSCSFCEAQSVPRNLYDEYGFAIDKTTLDFSRAQCAESPGTAFVPMSPGSCCGQCIGASIPLRRVQFCAFRRDCMQELVSAHECKTCGFLNAAIKCAREQKQSDHCANQTQLYCKSQMHASPCDCDGKIEKQPEPVCSPPPEYANCYIQRNGTVKVVYNQDGLLRCRGRNSQQYDVMTDSRNLTRCLNTGGGNRKRVNDYACAPGWIESGTWKPVTETIPSSSNSNIRRIAMANIAIVSLLLL